MAQDVAALITPYRLKTEVGERDWRSEYWGKWFTSLALADAYRPDAGLSKLRDSSVNELLKTAASDGYLGTRQPQFRMQGWDVWGCKYALLGLLADYDPDRRQSGAGRGVSPLRCADRRAGAG